ncbi:hypothetical protein EBU99_11690 [bacterium]|nr:hypothetical protein [bacterium]
MRHLLNSLAIGTALLSFLACKPMAQQSDSSVAMVYGDTLVVECVQTAEFRDISTRENLKLMIEGDNVKLTRITTLKSASGSKAVQESIDGKINRVFDGNVVATDHATVLLNPSSLVKKIVLDKNETNVGAVLINYNFGKIEVSGRDAKELMKISNCRTTFSRI